MEFTRQGFPWPLAQKVYHATPAMADILKQGFLTREQGAPSALGGNWNKSVSFTLSLPRAASIAIGLETLVKGAKKELSCQDLFGQLRKEAPQATSQAVYSGFNLSDITHQYDNDADRFRALSETLSYLDAGWVYYRSYPDEIKYRFGISVQVGPMSWVMPASEAQKQGIEESRVHDYLDVFYEIYRNVLAYGRPGSEAFNPIWFLPDLLPLKSKKLESVGILVATLSIPNVCTDAVGAVRLGYLTPDDLHPMARNMLDLAEHSCRSALSVGDTLFEGGFDETYDRRQGLAALDVKYWREPKLGKWTVKDAGLRQRASTMLFHDREEELIVFDPKKIKVVDQISIAEIRSFYNLGDRLTFPWFDDRQIDVRVVDKT